MGCLSEREGWIPATADGPGDWICDPHLATLSHAQAEDLAEFTFQVSETRPFSRGK